MRNFRLHPVIFWSLSILTLLITGLIAFTCWMEFYEVAINKNVEPYHFGSEGPVAEFEHYRSAETYTKRMIIDGLLSTILFISMLVCTMKKSDRAIAILAALTVGFIVYLWI